MKKFFRYTFRILSVTVLLSMAPSFPVLATAETPETMQPAPDASQTENSSPDSSQPPQSETVDVPQPDVPALDTPPAPETPAPDTVPSDTNTEVTPEPFTVTDFGGTYYVATENDLNVRSGPSTSYTALGRLSPGQEITVTGKTDNDWYRIQYTSDQVGYVSAQYLSDTPVRSEPSSPEADAETPAESASPENPPVSGPETETPETETEPSTYIERSTSFIGAHITIILVLCILVVVLLIGISVYGLFRHEASADEEEDVNDEDAYDEDSSYEDAEAYYEDDAQDAEPHWEPQDYYADDSQDAEPYENPEAYYEDDAPGKLNAASEKNSEALDAYYDGNEYCEAYTADGEPPSDEDLYIEDINDESTFTEDVNDVFDEDEYDK